MLDNYQQTENVEFSTPTGAGDFVALPPSLPDKNKSAKRWRKFKKHATGYIWCAPVILGMIIFTLIPMVLSLWYSMHDYDYTAFDRADQLTNFGFQNYIKIFTEDFMAIPYGTGKSLLLTFRYAVFSLAFSMIGSYSLALFMNQKVKGMGAYRVIYYLPCLIPSVAGTLLWADITNADYGYLNTILRALFGEDAGLAFYSKPDSVLPTLILTGVTSLGGSMVMWLAQMKNVPEELYEVADLDGANYLYKTFKITIPMTTPMIFYQLLMGIIGALQIYSGIYPLRMKYTAAHEELYFYCVKIYDTFHQSHEYAYACALSWVLFVIIGLLTLVVFRTSKWVFYGEEQ